MKKLTYTITIDAGAALVFSTMLERETYRQWTAAFDPSSDYEGSWQQGSKIYFLGPTENGKKQGMLAEIVAHIPNKFVSIRHYGMVDGDEEITDGPEIKEWAGALENYSFTEHDGKTTVQVDVDTEEDHVAYFEEAWPKALQKLKEISEQKNVSR